MPRDDLVSVIVPTYFRNEELRGAIESALEQTYDPVEVIVVDDSGEGHARSTAEAYPSVTYRPLDDNRGAQAARIAGLELASGEYVQFLDDDDRLAPEKLDVQVPILEAEDDVGVVYSGLQWDGGPAVRPKTGVRGDVLVDALEFDTAPCMIGTMLVERSVIDRVPLDEHTHGADDIGFKIELARATSFEYVDEVLLTRGNSEDSLGASWAAVEGRFTVLETYEDLYAEHPPDVRRAALAETYLVRGQRLLEDRPWSLAAIGSFGRAAYFAPGFDPVYAGAFLLGLFGRPGYALTGAFYSRFVRGDTRRGKST